MIAFLIFTSISCIGTAAEIIVQLGDSIQEAVNSASSGDEIIVKPGTYSEHIIVKKNSLIIRSESGNPMDTRIEAYDPGADILTIKADNVTLSGFRISGAGTNCSGISLYQCTNCLIDNNKLFNDSQGIYLAYSEENRVLNNKIIRGSRGIVLEQSSHNSVTDNKISGCRYGIYLLNSKENRISKNTVQESKEYGILLSASNSNTLSGNAASNNGRGIHIGNSDANKLSENSIFSNEVYGLFVCPRSDKNLISNNYFNNTFNIEANNGTSNAYNKPKKVEGTNIAGGPYMGGNYWAKPDGTGFSETATDADGDGIADKRYNFETSYYTDNLPLVAYKPPEPILPAANMSFNTPESYAPYSVQFIDLSENATLRNWDFENDGIIDSSDEIPLYTYPTAGTYTVNLTVENGNGTDSKLISINVEEKNVTEIQLGPESGAAEDENAGITGSQAEQGSGLKGISSIPGFEVIYVIFGLLAVFLYKGTGK